MASRLDWDKDLGWNFFSLGKGEFFSLGKGEFFSLSKGEFFSLGKGEFFWTSKIGFFGEICGVWVSESESADGSGVEFPKEKLLKSEIESSGL